jgi:hypothetical protein
MLIVAFNLDLDFLGSNLNFIVLPRALASNKSARFAKVDNA